MNIAALHFAIAKVAPIDGVSSDGTISFRNEATQAQRAAAETILSAWDWNAPDVPPTVTLLQLRKALRAANATHIGQINSAVNSASDDVKDAWQYGGAINRNDEIVGVIATKLSMTDAQMDALFIEAAKL
jgi:hypothetical protein